jgi:hypothetical protein
MSFSREIRAENAYFNGDAGAHYVVGIMLRLNYSVTKTGTGTTE